MSTEPTIYESSRATPLPDFQALFDASPVPQLLILDGDPDFTIAAVSEGLVRLLSLPRPTLVGRSLLAAAPLGLHDFWQTTLADPTHSQPILVHLPEPRYWRPIRTTLTAGASEFLLLSIQDVTEQVRAQQRDNFLAQLDNTIRLLSDPQQIIEAVDSLLGVHLSVDRIVFCTFQHDQNTFRVAGEYLKSGVPSISGVYALTQFAASLTQRFRGDQPHTIDDVNDPSCTPEARAAYQRIGIGATASVPLRKDGQLVAAIAAHHRAPHRWTSAEIDLLQSVASRCWESIERARISQDWQTTHARLSLAQQAGRIGAFDWLVKDNRVIWAPELESLYGLPPGTFEGSFDDWSKRVDPADAAHVVTGIEACIAHRQAEYTYEFRAILPDGTPRWLRGQAAFSYDDDGRPTRLVGINIDIDQQKRAEAGIRHQRQLFDALLSHTPDHAFTFDLNGRVSYANRPLLALWQKSLDFVTGKSLLELDYPADLADRLESQVQQVISTKQPLRDETLFAGPAGEERHYEYILAPVLSDTGEVEAVAGSSRDVTDRILADQLVRQDRFRWRQLLYEAPAAIALFHGPDHIVEWVNPEFLRIVGSRSPDSLLARHLAEALPETVSQGYLAIFNRVFQTGESFNAHEVVVSPPESPQELYLNFVITPTRNHHGDIDGVFLHATDVSAIVRARRILEENERQFRTLAETIPHLAWMAEPSGQISWFNQRWYQYTGTTLEQMQGWGWQSVHDPAVLPAVVTEWKAALASGTPFEMVFPLKSARGDFRSFLTRVVPVKDDQGRVVRWFGTNTDIHDQLVTEEELRRVNRELEEFAYVASHDLQEPLRMVNIYSHLILRALPEAGPELRQYADFVREGVTRMEALIRDLLTFSRTVHKESLPVGAADLSASLAEALAVLKSRIDESHAKITAITPIPIVRGDTNQLSHVFQNLISNSLKYRQSHLAPEISISATRSGDHWVVSLSDNGIGFDQVYADQIFGLFKRLHKNEYAGTGIGLAICKRTVERYGGRMWAESQPNCGSTFFFSLPGVENG